MDASRIESAALAIPRPAAEPGARSSGEGGGFAGRLLELVAEADRLQHDADAQVRELATGEGDTVETMVALSKADLALRFVVSVRNRALEAYQEIMRLQV